MSDPRELHTDPRTVRMSADVTDISDAAVHAAAAGDYASAESLLREAVGRQEAVLGPVHPDLAQTLNNLAVLCDKTDKVADAEALYRRAHAIAMTALPPEHPFVATSRKNLIDFCADRGIPVEAPPAPPTAPRAVVTGSGPATAISGKAQTGSPVPRELPRLAGSRASRKAGIGIVAVFGLVLAVYLATRPSGRSNQPAGSRPEIAVSTPAAPPRPTPEPSPAAPSPSAKEKATIKPAPAGEVASGAERKGSASARPVVATATLCRTLPTGSRTSSGDWPCVRTGNPVDPGPLVFYTRVRSATNTTIQHRWYRGSELRRVVELRVGANPTEGFRTFSRNAVDHRSRGDWKVEVRAKDGALLHQERFIVR